MAALLLAIYFLIDILIDVYARLLNCALCEVQYPGGAELFSADTRVSQLITI